MAQYRQKAPFLVHLLAFLPPEPFTVPQILPRKLIMNKGDLIEAVQQALGGDASKKDAETALAAVLDSIAEGVRKTDNVQIIGFGTFKKKHRAARMGRNPKTGEQMQINASTSVGFTPSAAFKKSL